MAERLTKFDGVTLEEWESGTDVPSLAGLRKLGEAYKRPLAVFLTQWAGDYAALTAWRAAVEAKGVLVFQTSAVELDEMRATCIPDAPLPVILLKANECRIRPSSENGGIS